MTKPKVIIITACYNSERFIKDTFYPVLSKTYHNIEYITVDGGSNEITMEIANGYEKNTTDDFNGLVKKKRGYTIH